MYSVYQHWDKLKVCVVGRSYPPEFYSYITNTRVRNVMERIAIETEEDYQKLIHLLESFNVKVLRPNINESLYFQKNERNKIILPPMTPRDIGGMFGKDFFMQEWWGCYDHIIDFVKLNKNNIILNHNLNTAMVTRVGKDLYFGSPSIDFLWDYVNKKKLNVPNYNKKFLDQYKILAHNYNKNLAKKLDSNYRITFVDTQGHTDSSFCPVVPGLIISLYDIQEYEKTFPDWEVVYLPNQSWKKVMPFLKLKEKNHGRWWVPGEELNDDFTEFVQTWLSHWVGFVEETVFDVNLIVVDKKNVIVNNYNKKVFKAFDRYGITPHVLNFRHRFFWDGGLHCITLDLDREGTIEDYFPERGEPSEYISYLG